MKATNLPNGAQRGVEVGFVWEEITAPGVASAPAPFEVQVQGSVRVHAVTTTTIRIAGVDAVTIAAGTSEILNVGTGISSDSKTTVTFEVTGGTAFVSRAIENDRGRRTK